MMRLIVFFVFALFATADASAMAVRFARSFKSSASSVRDRANAVFKEKRFRRPFTQRFSKSEVTKGVKSSEVTPVSNIKALLKFPIHHQPESQAQTSSRPSPDTALPPNPDSTSLHIRASGLFKFKLR